MALFLSSVLAVVLSIYLGNSARSTLLDKNRRFASLLVENLDNQIYRRFYVPSLSLFGEIALRNPVQHNALDNVVHSIIHGLHVNNLRILSSEGVVGYSLDPAEAGSRDPGSPSLTAAVAGKAPVFAIESAIPYWRAFFHLSLEPGTFRLRTTFAMRTEGKPPLLNLAPGPWQDQEFPREKASGPARSASPDQTAPGANVPGSRGQEEERGRPSSGLAVNPFFAGGAEIPSISSHPGSRLFSGGLRVPSFLNGSHFPSLLDRSRFPALPPPAGETGRSVFPPLVSGNTGLLPGASSASPGGLADGSESPGGTADRTAGGTPGTAGDEELDNPPSEKNGGAAAGAPGAIPASESFLMGVLELTQDITEDMENAIRFQQLSLAAMLLGLGLLVMLLLLFVRRAERALALRMAEKERLVQELHQHEKLAGMGRVVAGIAHEIRNPLGIISSSAELLIKRAAKSDPVSAKIMQAIYDEARRLSRTVTDFLDYARPRKLHQEPVDLVQILDQALVFLGPDMAERDIGSVRAGFPDAPVIVRGDKDLLYRAFFNIMGNAIQAMGAQGTLAISLERCPGPPPRLILTFHDSGPGFPEDKLAQLMDPFFTTKDGGTGLGLPIVGNIIAGHGGAMELDNAPEGGARVTVALPAAAGESGQ